MKYHIVIRQKICDYLSEHNYNDDEADKKEAEEKINNMRNDGVYGTGAELEAFSKLCKIRITYYIRHIKNLLKNKDDLLTRHVFGKEYPENFAILLSDYGVEGESSNHYEALEPRDKYNIDKNKLQKIKELLCNIDPNCNNKEEEMKKLEVKVISGRTGKELKSRKGDSIWNLYIPLTRRKKVKGSLDSYTVQKLNNEINKEEDKASYTNLTKCIPLSEIIDAFDKDNIKKYGLKNIIDNCKNIVIDKINNNIITNKEMNSIMNINDERSKLFNNCICYECSGINGKGKRVYRIYNSLYELKNHCVRFHNGSLDKCVINYRLLAGYVEIEVKKDAYRYIIHEDDLLDKDKDDYNELKQEKKDKRKKGGNITTKIKIYGENIRAFNETNRALLSDILDKQRPDFMLLNECNIGKAKFNMSGYKLELSDNNEVGILYKDIFYLNKSFEELEDNYNIIRMANTNNGNLIIYCTYILPGNEHDNRLNELIEKLLLLKRNYHSLSLILFGDLNIKRENIKSSLADKIEPYGFKVWFNNDNNIYTHEQKINNKIIFRLYNYIWY